MTCGAGVTSVSSLVRRIRSLPPLVQDTALAVVVVLLDLLLFTGATFPLVGTVVAGYAVAGALPLVWRRRAPFLVFLLLWLHNLLSVFITGYIPVLGLLLALYTVAVHCAVYRARVALLLALVANAVIAGQQAFFQFDAGLRVFIVFSVLNWLQTAGPWGIGRWIHVSRLHTRELGWRRQVEAREAVTMERARIARELHDIVAYTVTVMILEAAVAKKIMATDPAGAERALTDVDEHGRQAMEELRRMLVALRADDDNGPAADGSEPPRGLADLPALVSAIRRAGLSVDVESVGEPVALDSSVGLTAYRVAQEALTNTTKHAGHGAHVVVRQVWHPGGHLVVQVVDDGAGRSDHAASGLSTGHGLLGLRERVAVAGGRLDAGPTADGGFQVTATLPIAGRDRPASLPAPRWPSPRAGEPYPQTPADTTGGGQPSR
jgi:signal transduction histidine kinase